MNMKKILLGIVIFLTSLVFIAASIWGIKLYLREQDPRWHVAKETYGVQTALQEVDEKWQLDSLSEVTPFEIKGPTGQSINYYCCITSYLDKDAIQTDGLNKTAMLQIVDIDALDNSRECDVNGLDAVMGDKGSKTYLCWTISPRYSCVIEYQTGAVDEVDIFQMAESVS